MQEVLSGEKSRIHWEGENVRKEMSDEELKEIIRRLCKVADLSLDETRIQMALPAFKAQLEWVDILDAFELPMEAEPSPTFRLKQWTSK